MGFWGHQRICHIKLNPLDAQPCRSCPTFSWFLNSLGLDDEVSLKDHTIVSVSLATASTIQLVDANIFIDFSDSRLTCHEKALFLFMHKIKKELHATYTKNNKKALTLSNLGFQQFWAHYWICIIKTNPLMCSTLSIIQWIQLPSYLHFSLALGQSWPWFRCQVERLHCN